MTGLVQEVVSNRRYLIRIKGGLDTEMLLNHTTVVVVRSEVDKEINMREVEMIPGVCEELG